MWHATFILFESRPLHFQTLVATMYMMWQTVCTIGAKGVIDGSTARVTGPLLVVPQNVTVHTSGAITYLTDCMH